MAAPYPGWHRVYDHMVFVKDGVGVKVFDVADPDAKISELPEPMTIEALKNQVYYQRRKSERKKT